MGNVDLLEGNLVPRGNISAYDDPDVPADERQDGREFTPAAKTEASQLLVPILDGAQAALEQFFAGAEATREDAPVFATVERKRGRRGAGHLIPDRVRQAARRIRSVWRPAIAPATGQG